MVTLPGLDDGWGELRMPILQFAGTGMGGDWILDGIYTAHKSGSTDVTLNLLERYGHLDVLVGEPALSNVFRPTANWISGHAVSHTP